MRKRVFLLLSFVLAVAMSIGVLTACGGGKGTVELNKTSLTLVVGKAQSLTATASNGSEIEWSSDNESVASVAENGRVTAVATGTANVKATAKKGGASATCAVTVVSIDFKSGDEVVTEISMDMRTDLQLSIVTSDNSTATAWKSGDDEVATVSESGLVTGVFPGETNITVTTSSGVNAQIAVTVNPSGDFQEIVEGSANAAAGEWWYYTNKADGRQTNVNVANYFEGTVTFDYSGEGNWYIDDIQLGHKAPNGTTAGWKKVTGKIVSDVAGAITIFDTTVVLVEGDTTFSVCYQQTSGGNDLFIRFANTKAGSLLNAASVVISDLVWEDHTVEDLTTPSFTLTESDVAIEDNTNEIEGVEFYQIGLFKDADAKTPTYTQNFDISGGELDVSTVETNGEYIVRVKAVGNPGYNSSAWSEGNDVTYTVNNASISYKLADSGESGATASGKWTYWAGDGGTVKETPTYANGTVTLKSVDFGWAFYSTQIFRYYGAYSTGTDLRVTMNINSTHAGHITISGNVVELKVGNNEIELYYKAPAGATISIQMGVNGSNPPVDLKVDSENENDVIVVLFSNVVVEEFIPEPLETPSGEYTEVGEGDEKSVVITIIDEVNDETLVAKYEVGFFDASDKLIGTATIEEDGTFSDLAIKDGTYSLKVRAVPNKAAYGNSEWSAAIKEGYVIDNGGITYNIEFGGSGESVNSSTNPGTWFYWNDQNWTGSTVKMNQAIFSRNTVTLSYTVTAGASNNGVQLFYVNPDLTNGKDYKLTLKIHSDEAVDVTINGTAYSLVKGDNNLTVYYKEVEGHASSFSMQVKVSKDTVANNSLVLSELAWAEYTYIKLDAPVIAIDSEGVVTITDTNEAGVAGYVAGYYDNGGKLIASVKVENGKKIDVSVVQSGDYKVKLMAKAAQGSGYSDSDWSASVDYTVVNDAGVQYDMFLAADQESQYTDKFAVWAVQSAWDLSGNVDVSTAKYDNGTITITFTSSGTCTFGLQLKYKNTQGASGCSFDIEASSDMSIQIGNPIQSNVSLTANESQSLTFKGDYFYLHVDTSKTSGGTITVTNIQWN